MPYVSETELSNLHGKIDEWQIHVFHLEKQKIELLEALETVQSALSICGKGSSKAQLLNQTGYLKGIARAAIAKAKGEL